MSLKDRYAIVGAALTRFGKIPGVSAMSFTLQAIKLAVEDAGLSRDDVDGLLVLMPVRMVIEPLHLLDVCVNTDGGGAVVVTSAERARDLRHPPVCIMGMGQSHSSEMMPPWPGKTEHRGGTRAAEMAFRMAGVGHEDIDVAQFYDGFTILVINELENFGFCKLGEGGSFVEGGRLALDGELPSNTAGGLLSEGHLMGMGHVVEAVWDRLSGRGEVFTSIIVHQTYHPAFDEDMPYNVALVRLEEGPTLHSNIVECRNENIYCGMPVEVVFEDRTSEVSLPKFRPRSG